MVGCVLAEKCACVNRAARDKSVLIVVWYGMLWDGMGWYATLRNPQRSIRVLLWRIWQLRLGRQRCLFFLLEKCEDHISKSIRPKVLVTDRKIIWNDICGSKGQWTIITRELISYNLERKGSSRRKRLSKLGKNHIPKIYPTIGPLPWREKIYFFWRDEQGKRGSYFEKYLRSLFCSVRVFESRGPILKRFLAGHLPKRALPTSLRELQCIVLVWKRKWTTSQGRTKGAWSRKEWRER